MAQEYLPSRAWVRAERAESASITSNPRRLRIDAVAVRVTSESRSATRIARSDSCLEEAPFEAAGIGI